MGKHKSVFNSKAVKTALFSITLGVSVTFSGCGLIPSGEAEHTVSIVSEDVSSQYDLGMAELRDVSLTDLITCTYSQLKEEKYAFAKNGTVANVFVSEGDNITAGTLMASLSTSSYEKEISKLTDSIELKELKLKHAREKVEFYQKALDENTVMLTEREDYRLAILDCEEEMRSCEADIVLSKQKIEDDIHQIELSKIYSTVDGKVSYVKDDLLGSDAIADSLVMKVMDSDVCAFMATDKEAASYLTVGTAVTISLTTGVNYAATVSQVDTEKGKIVFELDEPDYTISVGTRGTIYIVRDERQSVLAVPRIAVYSTDDMYYVYVLNPEGVREIVKIEPGLIGNNYVEIQSGLQLYDSVILKKN